MCPLTLYLCNYGLFHSISMIRSDDEQKHFTSVTSKKVVRAVNGISMDIYSGEVFCLLGHNGAGKTTTISMLTGLLEITSGDAFILGNSVQGGMKTIRKSLGVCPQHDVLFKRLTVREHMELYCRLKGVPKRLIQEEVDRTMHSIGMMEKQHEFPPNLSGGQKRKVSLGIALIGGSKIVFLDEPTSGMDPQSRRVTWDLIAKEKRNRCIILTTHFMVRFVDSSKSVLLFVILWIGRSGYFGGSYRHYVDWISEMLWFQFIFETIIWRRVCCHPFHPIPFGNCYCRILTVALILRYTFTVSLKIGADPLASKEQIDPIVLDSVHGSSSLSVAGGEVSYRLPFEQTASFPDVFEELDQRKGQLNVATYGISITTLEGTSQSINLHFCNFACNHFDYGMTGCLKRCF